MKEVLTPRGKGSSSFNTLYLSSPRLCFFIVLKRDLFVYRVNDSLVIQRVIMQTKQLTKCFVPLQKGERGGLVVNASDSGSRGHRFEPHSGQTVSCP